MSLQGFTETDRWFDVAVKVAKEFMKSHIISSDSDRIAVVFYGSVRPASVVPHKWGADSQRPSAYADPIYACCVKELASMLLEPRVAVRPMRSAYTP